MSSIIGPLAGSKVRPPAKSTTTNAGAGAWGSGPENHFPIATRPVLAEDRIHTRGESTRGRRPLAGDRRSLAPPPGIDHRAGQPKPESVNQFSQKLVS